jgi:hypothetical protein
MCKNYVSIKIYACGTRGGKETFKFDPCDKQDKPGHEVIEIEMGSSKVKAACGKYTCAVCGAGNCKLKVRIFGNVLTN